MQHAQIKNTIDIEVISQDIEKLDELLHSLKGKLGVIPVKGASSSSYLALRSLRGILKGRISEDPLQYQRRIRAESDARL